MFTFSHLPIFTSAHPLTFTSSHPRIFSSSHLHICTYHLLTFITFTSDLLILTSAHLHICTYHLLTFTSAHLHIFISSHLHICTRLLRFLSPRSSFILLCLARGRCQRGSTKCNLFARNELSSIGKNCGKIAILHPPRQPFRRKSGSIGKKLM